MEARPAPGERHRLRAHGRRRRGPDRRAATAPMPTRPWRWRRMHRPVGRSHCEPNHLHSDYGPVAGADRRRCAPAERLRRVVPGDRGRPCLRRSRGHAGHDRHAGAGLGGARTRHDVSTLFFRVLVGHDFIEPLPAPARMVLNNVFNNETRRKSISKHRSAFKCFAEYFLQ